MAQQISDNLEVAGSVTVDNNLVVQGTITADTFNVKNLVTDNGSLASVGNWTYSSDAELIGKGFNWNAENKNTQLMYRGDGRLWTSAAYFDLQQGSSFSIDNIKVLSLDTLGGTVRTSSLTKVGTLQSLKVSGHTNLADFVFVNSDSNRIGIGTDEPSASLSIVDNNVVIDIGSPEYGRGAIGTASHHDFEITTDGLARVVVKAGGAVNIGDVNHGGGQLNVYGTLYVTNLVADYKSERTSPLAFRATGDSTAYGLGLTWEDRFSTREFVLKPNPDRFYSSASIDLAPHLAYYVNGMVGLSAEGLGDTIINSKLQTLGVLQSLHVSGDTRLENSYAAFMEFRLGNQLNALRAYGDGLTSTHAFKLTVSDLDQLSINDSGIALGNVAKANAPVKVFGKVGININNPDTSVDLDVSGDVRLGGKKFIKGAHSPTTGEYMIGDICWNTEPMTAGYVGWICIATGAPGVWAPFGLIN